MCNVCTTLCGSPGYFSPEMVRGEVQTTATDWWSFGVLLFEVAEGELPWEQSNDDIHILSQARRVERRWLAERRHSRCTAVL